MRYATAIVFFGLMVFGCVSSLPPVHADGYALSAADTAADTALALIGKPYRFKGDSPAGFDCSGLVRYSYLSAGVDLPHSTDGLRRMTHPVDDDIRKGDLLFFTQLGKKYSHVAISVGGRRFVHAPSSGKLVRMDSLDDPYWQDHFLGARRL